MREFSKFGFAYYYYNNKEGSNVLSEQVTFPVFKGLSLMPPYSGNSFKVKVPPGKDKIVIIHMEASGWDMSSSTRTAFRWGNLF